MSTPQVVSVSPLEIQIKWSNVTDTTQTGGDAIIYYQVEWYDGVNWQIITSEA